MAYQTRRSSSFLRAPSRTALLAAGLAATLAASAIANPTFIVSFDDPGNVWNAPTRAALSAHAQAAAQLWARSMAGSGTIAIEIGVDTSVPFGNGASLTTRFVFSRDGINYFEQAAAAQLRGLPDVNGAAPDIRINFNPAYVSDELWLDPQPTLRTAPVPVDRTDAVSVFIHELGHAFCFNGWSNGVDDVFPGDYRSTWDQWLVYDGTEGRHTFNGPRATAFYGGPVPVTTGNPSHYANPVGEPGDDLIPGLMNGVVFNRGVRYQIGQLERAILLDCGIPSRCPSDVSGPGQSPAPDGQLTADDIIVFLNRFFASDVLSDVSGPGQNTAALDGQLTADDIIVFLNRFFAGC